jgi:hypothetical protein
VPRDAAVGTQLGQTVQTTITWHCPPDPSIMAASENPAGDAYWLMVHHRRNA